MDLVPHFETAVVAKFIVKNKMVCNIGIFFTHIRWNRLQLWYQNPPVEPITLMESAPVIRKEMSRCLHRGWRGTRNPTPIKEPQSHHQYFKPQLHMLCTILLLYLVPILCTIYKAPKDNGP